MKHAAFKYRWIPQGRMQGKAQTKKVVRWTLRRALQFVLLAVWQVAPAAAQTQYGSPVKVAPIAQPGSVTQIAVLDLNGDGFDDVLAASLYFPPQTAGIPVQVLLNNGHGGFFDGTSQVIAGPVPNPVHPRKIVIADFNGDGKPDIFIADHGYDADPFPGSQSRLLSGSKIFLIPSRVGYCLGGKFSSELSSS